MKTFQIEELIAQITKFTEMFRNARTGSFRIHHLFVVLTNQGITNIIMGILFSLAAVVRPTFFSVRHFN